MSNPYVGEIRMFAGNFAPVGWAFCQGQTLPISENEVLFNLIGTTYGGDGQNTFNLPDLSSRIPVHMGTGPSGQSYALGEAAGTETVTLTSSQIPGHTHTAIAVSGNTNGVANPANATWGSVTSGSPYSDQAADAVMNGGSLANAGGSQPHENLIPFLCVNFIISLFGIFPSQT